MSYNTIAAMAHDGDLQQRMIACAAQEGVDDPQGWVLAQIWHLVDADDLAASYQYAIDGDHDGIGMYGKRGDVINDGTILSAVQARVAAIAAETPTEPPA